jgi:peptidylprolyl isomerase
MVKAKRGDTVKLHFTGRLENDEVFDTSKDDEPLIFTTGTEKVIPGFEKAIIGMEVGETKTVTIPPEEAYGPRYKELILDFKKNAFSNDITLVVGEQLKIRQKGHDPIKVTVADIDDDTVTLDGNHPLAGKTLIFDIHLVGIT